MILKQATEKYMSFTIQRSKEKKNIPKLPLVFIDSVHFLMKSLKMLVKNLGECEFHHLIQECNARKAILNL